MNKTVEVQLLPTRCQTEQLMQHAGAVRWLWNQLLERNIKQYDAEHKFIFRFEMQRLLPDLKKEYSWLSDINSQSLQEQCINLNKALLQKIKNKKTRGFPKFKSKYDRADSFVVPQSFHVCNRSIKLPKIGRIKYVKHRRFEGKVKRIIVKQRGDKWVAMIVCEMPDTVRRDFSDSEIAGIDVGIKDFAILSDGTKIANPKHFNKSEKLLRRTQKEVCRKCRGSKKHDIAKQRVKKLHNKIRNQRADFHWKLVSSIAKKYTVVAMEDLNVRGMVKNRRLAKHIGSAGWVLFKNKLNHQLAKKGGFVVNIDKFAPSTKTCSSCGVVREGLTLSDRTWVCGSCDEVHDRDINAALNIRQFGIEELLGKGTCRIYACGDASSGFVKNQNETMSMKQEPELPLGDPTYSTNKW